MLYAKVSDRISRAQYNQTMGGYIDPSVKIDGCITVGRNVVIEEDCEIGDGCFFGHNAIMRPHSRMGHHSELRAFGWIANCVRVGHHTTIYQYANICLGATLGNYIYFGVGSICTNADDIVLHRGREFIPKPPVFNHGVRVATRCLFMPGVRIRENAMIGAGSLVTKDVPAGQLWMGHPARYVRDVLEDDIPEDWRCENENTVSESESTDEVESGTPTIP